MLTFTIAIFILTRLVNVSISSNEGQNATSNDCIWKFQPGVRDRRQGRLFISIKNEQHRHFEYSQHLFCSKPLLILTHAKDHISVSPLDIHTSSYIIGLSRKDMARFPDRYEHKCTYSKWKRSETGKDVDRCSIIIRTYLEGVFLEKCKSYTGKDLMLLTEVTKENEKTIHLKHEGNVANYVANISCNPNINLLHHGNIYKSLKDNEKWLIQLPPNCSKVVDIDYEGTCSLSIYHMCQEKGLVKEYGYPYMEGHVETCAYLKATRRFNFMEVMDDDFIKHLLIAIVFFLSINISMIIAKIIYIMSVNGLDEGQRIIKLTMTQLCLKCFCCFQRKGNG